jgi:hypothetical protein
MRSIVVCGGDAHRTARAAVKAIHKPELQAILKAYPKTTKKWGNEGAADFNRAVMLHGIAPACRSAVEIRSGVERAD